MADETRKVLLELEFDTVQAVKNQKELRDLIKSTTKELQAAEIGSEEYKKLEVVQGTLQKRLKSLTDQTKYSNAELSAQKGSLRDLQSQYGKLATALREAAPGSEVLGQSFEDAKKKAFELKEEIKDFEAELGNTAPNVGNYGDAFKDAAGGVEVFGVSLGQLFKVIVANPIGLILLALTGLYNILMKNNAIADIFKGIMTGLGVIMDNIAAVVGEAFMSLSNFGGESSKTAKIVKDVLIRVLNQLTAPLRFIVDIMPAVSAALKGEFSEAAGIAGKASVELGKNLIFMNNEVPELIKNIAAITSAGIEYEQALGDIEEAQNKLNVRVQELTNQRDKLLLQSKDLSKSEEERIKLSEQAEAVNKKILEERLELLDREIAAQKEYVNEFIGDTDNREKAEFRLRDLYVERLKFQNEALRFDELAQNKRNALIEKQAAEAERLAEIERKEREKQQKEAEEFVERSFNSQVKLTQFRLDHAAKIAKDADEKLKAQLKAEDFRVSVLLDNEKLLASEREFIIADSAARIEEINRLHEEAIRAEAKKTAAEKKQAFINTEQDIIGFLQQAANTAQIISDTRLNKELSALDKRQAQEVRAAGNNKAKIEEINKKYDEKRANAERDAASRAAEVAKISALINGAQAFTKSLTAAPFPFNLILAAGTAAATAAQIAKISSEQDRLALGGIVDYGKAANGIMIGGKPHSMGGTKFVGSDGTRFEAERGELLAVVNKRDTPLLSMLSQVNSIHGKPFFRDGGIQHLQDGGFAARFNSEQVVSSAANRSQIMDIISSLPPQVVFVEDINTGQSRVTQVQSRADI